MSAVAVTVETGDLRAAIAAVLPHVDKDDPDVGRIRVDVDSVNITLSATDRYTAAIALVSADDVDGTGTFTFGPVDAASIAAVFKPVDKTMPSQLRIEAKSTEVTVTEADGLWPGKSLTVATAVGEDNLFDVRAVLCDSVRRMPGFVPTGWVPFQAAQLARFTAAGRAYGEPLVLLPSVQQPSGRDGHMVVTCGESFLGAISPAWLSEDGRDELTRWRDAWSARLPDRLDRPAIGLVDADDEGADEDDGAGS